MTVDWPDFSKPRISLPSCGTPCLTICHPLGTNYSSSSPSNQDIITCLTIMWSRGWSSFTKTTSFSILKESNDPPALTFFLNRLNHSTSGSILLHVLKHKLIIPPKAPPLMLTLRSLDPNVLFPWPIPKPTDLDHTHVANVSSWLSWMSAISHFGYTNPTVRQMKGYQNRKDRIWWWSSYRFSFFGISIKYQTQKGYRNRKDKLYSHVIQSWALLPSHLFLIFVFTCPPRSIIHSKNFESGFANDHKR